MWLPWRAAMERALYGVGGFYRAEGAAGRHFRTSVSASGRFAVAVAALLAQVDTALGRPGRLDVVDIGAGGGQLLCGVHDAAPENMRERLRLTGVEVGPRPGWLPEQVRWAAEPPDSVCGLIVANEWLDNVPVDVVKLTADGPRLVLVNTVNGEERLGEEPGGRDAAWLAAWWPLETEPGDRAEIGWPRDERWAALTSRLDRGVAVAVDYGPRRDSRPRAGSLTGYRLGRQVAPVPDGSCDLTAHVALDSCAARAGSVLTTQRRVLTRLGVRGERPPLSGLAPAEYLRRLAVASQEGELVERHGLGGFGWLVHARGMPLPAALAGSMIAGWVSHGSTRRT
jgi:SAM-dependent MidA family methyltransferase